MMDGLGQEEGLLVTGGFGRHDAHAAAGLLAEADVLVDFTTAEAAPALLMAALDAGVRPVSGTTGLPPDVLDAVDRAALARGLGAVWAPNFAIGAALMMHFARVAARYMGAAEIIELHHDAKVDAPSGTALTTAHQMRAERGSDFSDPPVQRATIEGARGAAAGGVRIHSVRLPGLVAHQEVLFGARGQWLTIRHDATGRDTYVPGVALAARAVMGRVGLTRGLDTLMGLASSD